MAGRISSQAPYGSLLKGTQPKAKGKDKRVVNESHLALIRQCPCLSCDQDPAREAAHVRMSAPGKPVTGTGIKPDDRWALPLCHDCHMKQHAVGETKFWADLGIDPIWTATELSSGGDVRSLAGMRAYVMSAKQDRT
jgi:hypothetical protein